MPNLVLINLDRLQASLLTSGLQTRDNSTFQVISQLINAAKQLQNAVNANTTDISNTTNNITNVIGAVQILPSMDSEYNDDNFSLMGFSNNNNNSSPNGYWAPLTDGDDLEMDLISNFGETIMVFVPL